MSTVEVVGTTYLIGTLLEGSCSLPIHIYVALDGWIIAYLPKEEVTSKILRKGNTSTLLDAAIARICSALDIQYQFIGDGTKYYDFRYPEASSIVIIGDGIDTTGTDSGTFFIGDQVTVFEATCGILADSYNSYYSATGSLSINDTGAALLKRSENLLKTVSYAI